MSLRALRLLPALLLLAAFPPAANAQTAAETSVRAWIAGIDAEPDWAASYREIVTDAARNTVIRGLVIRNEKADGYEFGFDTVSLQNYAEGSGGGFSAAALNVGSGKIKAGPVELTLTDIRFTGVAVPALGQIRFDPAQIFTSMIRAYDVTARARLDQGRIREVTLRQMVNGTLSTVTYQNLALDKLANGKLDLMTAGPMSMSAPAPEGMLQFTIDRLETRDADFGALVHVYDPSKYAGGVGDGQWRRVVRLATYRNMRVVAAGTRFAIGDISLEDMQLRQPPKSFTEMFDRIVAEPNMPSRDVERLMGGNIVNMLSSFSLGRMGFKDIDVENTGIDHLRIGDFFIENFSLAGLGQIGVGGVRVEVPGEVSLALDRFAFGGINFAPADLIQRTIDAGIRGENPDLSRLVPRLGFIETAGLQATNLLGLPKFALSFSRLDLGSYIDPIPTSIRFALRGLDIDIAAIGNATVRQIFQQLQALGYQRAVIDHGFSADWRETDETLAVSGLHIAMKDAGQISVDAELSGLKRSMLERPTEIDAAWKTLLFKGARIAVTDQSLTDRVLGMQAKKLNLSLEDMRTQISGAVPFALMMLRNPGFQGKLAPALQAFLAAPGAITVTAQPKTPVPLSLLAETAEKTPQRLPDLLAVEVVKDK